LHHLALCTAFSAPWARPTTRRCCCRRCCLLLLLRLLFPHPLPPFSPLPRWMCYFFVNIHLYNYVLDPVMCVNQKKSGLKTSKFIGKKFQSIFIHLKKSIHFILLINLIANCVVYWFRKNNFFLISQNSPNHVSRGNFTRWVRIRAQILAISTITRVTVSQKKFKLDSSVKNQKTLCTNIVKEENKYEKGDEKNTNTLSLKSINRKAWVFYLFLISVTKCEKKIDKLSK
jgi:hypothetical protein